ncbi:putative tail tubular protein [uncultured Mediterranean phage uvMED]|nr:putative tail tubular protein [uncultured Mediterranean phage uvMED]
MASAVDIANSALNLLGASTISAFTDDSKNARLINQRYENVRNRVFRSHAWNCLHKRVQLAQNSTAPVIEYTYAYALPSDCLRVLKVHNGTTDSIQSAIDYKLEGRNIVTDEGTVYLIYVALDTDPNNYDSYLQESISHQLAADLCYAITNNATLANNYMARADERLREARFIDASENSLGTIESNEFTDARL